MPATLIRTNCEPFSFRDSNNMPLVALFTKNLLIHIIFSFTCFIFCFNRSSAAFTLAILSHEFLSRFQQVFIGIFIEKQVICLVVGNVFINFSLYSRDLRFCGS